MDTRPNIIFYFVDQQRADTCGCYGQPLEVTPVLDQLAEEGVVFENAFTPQPVCGPCRAIFQTGKYATELGCQKNDKMFPVSVQYLTEVGDEDYNWVTLYDGPDACCILITSDSWASDLSIWNLFVEDVADDGTMTCSATLAGDDCHWDTVTSDTPIAVQLIFPGDLPAYGISYEDQYGALRRFAIEVSGYDGSLLLREADPNESEFVLK